MTPETSAATKPICAAEAPRELAPDVVHVWRIPVQVPADPTSDFDQVLSPAEQARASRFTRHEDRCRFQTGRAAMRCILGRYLGLAPAQVSIEPDRRGKPQVTASTESVNRGLQFNVSHSGRWIVAAFARSFPVGIDVEQVRAQAITEDLIAYVMSERERCALQSLPRDRQPAAFFKGWTSKEALLKGHGVGVTVPLKAIEVSIDPDQPALLIAAPGKFGPRDWQLHTLEFAAPYAATLAVAARSPRIVEVIADSWREL
jgi:4'-phosphopantetheinyl transferase